MLLLVVNGAVNDIFGIRSTTCKYSLMCCVYRLRIDGTVLGIVYMYALNVRYCDNFRAVFLPLGESSLNRNYNFLLTILVNHSTRCPNNTLKI